jgi:hypothetical protein
LDNFILVQEEIHANSSREESGMAIKLNMTNAFDRVEYNFLFKVMKKFGFSQNFIAWCWHRGKPGVQCFNNTLKKP